jgi:regulator of cell morphogenesis and NO signaling
MENITDDAPGPNAAAVVAPLSPREPAFIPLRVYKLAAVRPKAGIDEDATLAELASERPARIRLFERLALDYCCGGARSLGDACRERGLDVDAVREQLAAVDREAASPGPEPERDWRQAKTEELCEHIVSTHHGYLRRELPRISELLATVVRVHGTDCIDFEIIQRAFASLRVTLAEHIEEEERELFPACIALERGDSAVSLDHPTVQRHRDEHEAVGGKLTALRALAGGYDLSQALCSTHGALLDALRLLEADLHRHIHEENNVLLPRIDALVAARAEVARP